MTSLATATSYTVDDLDAFRDLLGARVELDPWGNLVVSPASDLHEIALRILRDALLAAVRRAATSLEVFDGNLAWRPHGGSGYTTVPDLLLLRAGWRRAGAHDLHFDPPPALVVEMASRSTRAIDRGRKRADYLAGGAEAYWLVDLPVLVGVPEPTVTVLERRGAEWEEHTTTGRLAVDAPVPLDLDLRLLQPGTGG